MNIIERFIASRDYGWKLEQDEIADALVALNENRYSDIYIVMNGTGQYLVNKNYIKNLKVDKRGDQE